MLFQHSMENIPLPSDLVDMPAESSKGGSRNERQVKKKETTSGSTSVQSMNPEVTSFWEPEITDRSEVDKVTAATGYTHDAF